MSDEQKVAPPRVVYELARDVLPGVDRVEAYDQWWDVEQVDVIGEAVEVKLRREDDQGATRSGVVVSRDRHLPRLHRGEDDPEEPEYRPIGEDQIRGEEHAGLSVYAHWSGRDDAAVVQVETDSTTPRLRVYLNDATLYDGHPDTQGALDVDHLHVLLELLNNSPLTNVRAPWLNYETGPHDPKSTAAGWYRLRDEAHAMLTRMVEDGQ